MELGNYYLDTYVLIDFLKGNKTYSKYMATGSFVSQPSLFELHYYFMKNKQKSEGDMVLKNLEDLHLMYGEEAIKLASRIKHKFRKRKLSQVDCIGYAISLLYGLKFVTGDLQFRDLPNVEYIK